MSDETQGEQSRDEKITMIAQVCHAANVLGLR
jgi:hypothetical protein